MCTCCPLELVAALGCQVYLTAKLYRAFDGMWGKQSMPVALHAALLWGRGGVAWQDVCLVATPCKGMHA